MKTHLFQSVLASAVALTLVLGTPLAAFEIGQSGINLSPPEQGWKIEDHTDAALQVWHLRAEDWAKTGPYSGLIAVTISALEGDPWPDTTPLRNTAARVISGKMLTDIRSVAPFALAAGRFDITGEDFDAGLDLGAGGVMPITARLLVIRTGNGTLIVTAFSTTSASQAPFSGLFGPNGILMASGPGAEVLNGQTVASPPPPPIAAAPPPMPQTDPGIADLLQQMEGGFSGTGGRE